MKPSWFPQLLLLATLLLLLSFTHGCSRKMMAEILSHRDSTVAKDQRAAREVFEFHLDYLDAGPNFNGKSGVPFPTPPPPSPSAPPPAQEA